MMRHDDFNRLLLRHGTLVIDGALATELEARGHDLNHPLWSAKILKDDPTSIKQVHLDYYLAGANIAITASYQASLPGFRRHFHMTDDQEMMDLIKQSVRLAQQARDEARQRGVDSNRRLLIAGSVGPYGAYLADGSEYRGDYKRSKEEFKEFHRPRIQALLDAGVDLLAIETMPKLDEVEAILELLLRECPDTICWLSFTLRDSRHIADGTPLQAISTLAYRYPEQIVAMGFNCVPVDMVSDALSYMEALTELPLVCYPNSGETWDANSKTWAGREPGGNEMVTRVRSWRAAGARVIGGCCRTGPEYIKIVVETLEGNPIKRQY